MNSAAGSDIGRSAAGSRKTRRLAPIVFFVALALALCAAGAILFLDLPKTAVGMLVVVLTIVLLLTGIPVGVAMLGAALLGLWELAGARVVASTMRSAAFESSSSWSYSVIPMFILMGMILWKSGLTATAFETARRWLGWLPGGLAVATNFAGAALAARDRKSVV